MSCTTELNDLMKEINRKFRTQRRFFEQERHELTSKLENLEKRFKERDDETDSLRQELSSSKKRNQELEKLLADQNSLIQRMRSKLQISFDNTFNRSNEEIAGGDRSAKPITADKCVSTENWSAILEKELTERIEAYAAFVNSKENRGSNQDRLSTNGFEQSNGGDFDRYRSGQSSIVNRSRFTDAEDELSKIDRDRSRNRQSIIEENGIGIEEPPLSLVAARGASTPATSVWHASTPKSNRHHSRNGGREEISRNNRSLQFDDTLRDAASNLDNSTLADDLLKRFSELEMEAQALFDLDDFRGDVDVEEAENGNTSKISSVLTDN